MFLMGWSKLVSKRKSRLVTIPMILPLSTTGKPEILCNCVSAMTSRTVMWLWIVIGSFTTPDSKRLTRATCAACFIAVIFLWIKPKPPSCAKAIANGASVTVSIAAERRGMFSCMLRVSCVARETSRGSTLEYAGTNKTSSKVRACCNKRMRKSLYPKRDYTDLRPKARAQMWDIKHKPLNTSQH